MYEIYWNLVEKPFQNTVDSQSLFYGETHQEAYIRLLYGVTEEKGLVLLTGDGGCGKTFICKHFYKEMLEQGYKVAFINNPNLEPIELLQQINYEYGLDYSGKTKLELLKNVEGFIRENAEANHSTVLIVDEVQLIQNQRSLEEIRLLLNFDCGNRFPLTVILVGKPEFGQSIRRLPSLQERIGLQYRLRPLSCQETGEYICHHMDKAGCSREIFTADAIKEVYGYSGGIARKINHVCDLALLLGYGDGCIVVDKALIQKAANELQGVTYAR